MQILKAVRSYNRGMFVSLSVMAPESPARAEVLTQTNHLEELEMMEMRLLDGEALIVSS